MRKNLSLWICLVLILALAGCGNGGSTSGKTGSQSAGVEDVLEQGMAEADSVDNESSKAAEAEDSGGRSSGQAGGQSNGQPGADGIDVDLTALSSTMVYSEVYNMVSAPDEYIGKTVKMKGPFAVYHDETTDNYYFACVIRDATACCAQGIEFELADKRTYPDDYPEIDEEICVVGVFDTYKDGEYTYCTLRNAKLL